MAILNQPQRMLFTFRRNGDSDSKRLAEITAEPLEQHEDPATAAKQSWFGAEDEVAATLERLTFSAVDVEGVVAALHTNRNATREMDVLPSDLCRVYPVSVRGISQAYSATAYLPLKACSSFMFDG